MSYDDLMRAAMPEETRIPMVSARDLQEKVFPPIRWLVDELLPEGLTLFCGKPKEGKSWAALDLACAVAGSSQFLGKACEEGDVFYLALEDNERRLQDRLRKIRSESEWPERLSLATRCPALDKGGLDAIEDWQKRVEKPTLVIIDTLATVRPTKTSGQTDYQGDYAALRGLHGLAASTRLSIVVIHHLRKADSDDPFDSVSGSTGLTGAADTTLIIKRVPEKNGAILYGRGRDLAEFEHGLEFDLERCRWRYAGDPDTVFLADTRKAILEAMKDGKQTIGGIAEHAELTDDNTKQTLRRMLKQGLVQKEARGCYVLP